MKIRICAALLIALLTLSALTGCAAPMVDTVVMNRLPIPEFRSEVSETMPVTAAAEPKTAETIPPAHPEVTEPVQPLSPEPKAVPAGITEEEATRIALDHAGLDQNQVAHLRARYDRDDRVPEYDVEFREGRWEYEYEIHAETGKILSWEKDD